MSYHKITLKAGIPFRRDIIGRLLLIDDCGVAGKVDVQMLVAGSADVVMYDRRAGFRRVAAFEGVILTSAVDTVVKLFLAMEDVQLGVNELEISNPADNPVNVLFAGTVNPVLGVVTVDNTDAEAIPIQQKVGHVFQVEQASEVDARLYQAAVVTNVAPLAVTAVAGVMLAASATRRGFRVKNNGANAVAIGGAGIVFADAVVLIQPGETWNENEAPGAAWYAICDAAAASSLNIQTIA